MKLKQVNIPENADAALVWAAHKEFDMRYRSYRRHVMGTVGASFMGITMAMKRLGEAFRGTEASVS